MAYRNGMAAATAPKVVKPKAKAGDVQKFDPAAFAKMRGDIKQEQVQAARIASRGPVKPVGPAPKDQMKLGEKEVFGLRARRDYANRMAGRSR